MNEFLSLTILNVHASRWHHNENFEETIQPADQASERMCVFSWLICYIFSLNYTTTMKGSDLLLISGYDSCMPSWNLDLIFLTSSNTEETHSEEAALQSIHRTADYTDKIHDGFYNRWYRQAWQQCKNDYTKHYVLI